MNTLRNEDIDILLLVIFNAKPNCYHLDRVERNLKINNIQYKEFEDNDYSGFYDWLRNAIGQIIGIRYTRLDPFNSTLVAQLKKIPYINFVHKKIIEIYFSHHRNYLDSISNDQDFGTCKLYVSADQTYAMLFDAGYLISNEFSSILFTEI